MRNFMVTQTVSFLLAGMSYFTVWCTHSPSQEIQNTKVQLVATTRLNASPVVDRSAQRAARFQNLVSQWVEERGVSSSITANAMRPAYQQIIGLGPEAVPLILAQLRAEGDDPDQWFWALQVITGLNPVDPRDAGNYVKMARAWLDWGDHEGYGQ
jgi:hypothetical protein